MPKVSIIMPALNSIKYLRKCMDSVVNQTLRDIEIIPVDAGSTDGTWELFQEYAAKDSRVKPLHSDKKSSGYQDNIGIDAATGDYIGFVETDDYVELDMFETLYNAAVESGVDWVKSDYDEFIEVDGEFMSVKCKLLQPELYDCIICPVENRPVMSTMSYYIWNGIYNRDFLKRHDVRQNETPGASFQDAGFANQVMMCADKVLIIPKSFYRYRRDNETSSNYSGRCTQYITDEFAYLLQYMKKNRELAEYWLPYYHAQTIRNFDNWTAYAVNSEKCPPDLRQTIKSFAGLLRESHAMMPEALRSWTSVNADAREQLILYDIDLYYNQLYIAKRSTKDFRHNWIQSIRAYPKLIIFGAGDIGSRCYIFMRSMGIESVVCFCDNNVKKQGTSLLGVPVLSVKEAMSAYPDAAYLVANVDYGHEINLQLQREHIQSNRIFNASEVTPRMLSAMVLMYGQINRFGRFL